MSDHPNAILMLVFEPDDLPRKTAKQIIKEHSEDTDLSDADIQIGSESYHFRLMDDDYDEGMQISAPQGSIVFFDLVTYGFGDTITWEKLEKQKNELEEFGKMLSEKYKGTYSIHVTANYW